jgi:hypothetical protein
VLTHPSPLQRQGSGSHLPALPQQPQLQDQPQRNSMARQVAALVSNRWLWRLLSRGEAQGEGADSKGRAGHSRSGQLQVQHTGSHGEGEDGSDDGSPGALATITTDADAAGLRDLAAAALSAQRQRSGFGGGAQQDFDSNGDGGAHPLKQHSARAFILRMASSISRMSSRAGTAEAAPDAAAIHTAAAGLDFSEVKSAFSAASGNSRFDGLAASKKKLLASWASWR